MFNTRGLHYVSLCLQDWASCQLEIRRWRSTCWRQTVSA